MMILSIDISFDAYEKQLLYMDLFYITFIY